MVSPQDLLKKDEMKVIFSHDHMFFKHNQIYYTNGGLSYSVLKRYVEAFSNITVISRQKECLDIEEIHGLTLASGHGVNFVSVPNFKSIKSLYLYTKAIDIVESEVKNSDLIVARVPSSISYLVIKAAIKFKKPYLVEVVGCAWDANKYHGSLIGKISAPYAYLKMKKMVKNAPYAIYITKEFLQSRYPNNNKTIVCPNVKIQEVNQQVLEKRLEKINNINIKGEIKLGLIGSLDVNYKGHKTAILAVKYLKEIGVNVKIEFLGQGNNERWLSLAKAADVEKQIFFKGSLPSGQAVYDWIDSLDIMVQPSAAEAQGRSIIEGMSRGCPIIATKVGGIVELIQSDLLIDIDDYVNLSRKILDLLNDLQKMKSIALQNFNEAKSYYASEIEKNRYIFLKGFKEDFYV